MTPTLHLIADDLEGHAWYEQLVARTVTDAEALVARWAAFEDHVSGRGETAAEPEEPRV